ncbi:hypothetical protein D0860_05147 [Hortaea werneckii]|uniref:Uncharacterized protein n=2 Tax=Hortaea werneckii TaxID=91943 RepID=A0A3M7IZZ4_HORWE|nr:hypothetical protein D0860_05147 [Hortaea werneckii]RMZ31054.1 hypothetical protein D0859_04867 [Hortaea werneckii]
MEADLFAVVVTGGLHAKRVETFFRTTYQKACQMDCAESLVLIDSFEDFGNKVTPKPEPTRPPISRSPRSMKLPLEAIAQEINKKANDLPEFTLSSQLFAVLDERSAREDNGLIVQIRNDGAETVRVHFDTIAAEITRISMVTFDISETIDLAKNAPDGVYRTETPQPHQRGGPAPRKKLSE